MLFFLYSLYSSAFVTLQAHASPALCHRDRARTVSTKSVRDARYHRRAGGRLLASKYDIVYNPTKLFPSRQDAPTEAEQRFEPFELTVIIGIIDVEFGNINRQPEASQLV